MAGCVLLWSLPESWFQLDLLDPDVESRIATRLHQRLGASGLDQDRLDELVALEVAGARGAQAEGVILWAFSGQGESSAGLPSGLSLTLALASLPDPAGAPAGPGELQPPGAAGGFASSVVPMERGDDAKAFMRETRSEVPAEIGVSMEMLQVQVFVVPPDEAGTAVVTVTTFDPESDDEARTVARAFANTLLFVPVDTVIEDPPPDEPADGTSGNP